MCDIRIASESAKFGETFVSVGLIPGDGGAFFLQRAVGFQNASYMAFTGKILDARKALEIGLVKKVVPDDNLMEESIKLAREIASKPPKVLRMVKRLMYMARELTLPEVLEISAAYQALCHYTEDHHEALEAILSKRKPSFRGK